MGLGSGLPGGGCRKPSTPTPTPTVAEAVSVVDGQAITAGELRSMMAASGLPREEVLDRLQARVLLLGRAGQRAGELGTPGRRRVQQALVQAYLAATVETIEPTLEQLQTLYEESSDRFTAPERRLSRHVLALVEPDASPEAKTQARDFARQMIALLKTAPDFAALQEKVREAGEGLPFEVKAERVPPADRQSRFAPPYLDALFSLEGLGVVPEPIETSFGVHAIEVVAVQPARHATFEEAQAVLRPELTTKLQADELAKRYRSLRRSVAVEIVEDALPILAEIER